MKTNANRLCKQGPSEVMKMENVELPTSDEVTIEQTAIGLDYMDVYQRSGYYPLMCRTYPVKAGENVLFRGVGHLAGQWGKHIGAGMISVTSGAENCKNILKYGYTDAIDRTSENVSEPVRELTDGKEASIVFDSVGKASFDASIASLAPRGFFISFSATTGEAPAVSPSTLQRNGALYFCRPSLANYVATRDDLELSSNAVFDLVENGVLNVSIDQKRALAEIASVHDELEAGTTTGSTLLTT